MGNNSAATSSTLRDHDPIRGADLAEDRRGNARRDHTGREIARNERARADGGVRTNRHARADHAATDPPPVVGDGDRLTVFPARPARVGIDGMRRGGQLDVCGNLAYLPDVDGVPSTITASTLMNVRLHNTARSETVCRLAWPKANLRTAFEVSR